MFGSAVIDIAIGIVFVFLLVSVIASTINEIILSLLNMRGKELLEGLKTIMDDANATGLVAKLYNHGLIFGLFKGDFDAKKPGNLPSYIPAQNFVMAFLDVVPEAARELRTATAAAAAADGTAALPGAPQVQSAKSPPPGEAPDQLQKPGAAGAGGQGVPPSGLASPASQVGEMFASLRDAAQKLADNKETQKVGKPLLSMLVAAGNDAAKLNKSVEDWFNSAMDRVSGWYKYRTQWTLFWIGLVLAVALNANPITIVRQLSKDSALRQSVVAAAGAAKQPGSTTGQPIKAQIMDARTEVDAIDNLGIPLGWDHTAALWDFDESKPNNRGSQKVIMLLGWLITALGVSLGAPFWFDMLNKIMVVRSTVKPNEKSQEEGSKDAPKDTKNA